MTDEILKEAGEQVDPIDVPAVEDAPAEVFTEADVEARLSEARLSWEAERERAIPLFGLSWAVLLLQ